VTIAEQVALVYEEQLQIPMRDGTPLTASLTRPAGDGPFPTMLVRTPYDRMNQRLAAEQWARAGYAFVRQDVRGRFDSEGEFYPFRDDPEDGYDTVEWLAQQPWCSGLVGSSGASHVGTVQYLMAPRRPPALAAAIPEFAPASVYHYWWWHGGAFRLSFNVAWAVLLSRDNLRHYPERLDAWRQQQSEAWVTPEEMRRLEIKPLFRSWSPQAFAHLQDVFGNSWFQEFMSNASYGPFWQPYDFTRQHHEFATPMLHVGG
jgi:putative CocE/NonD family hydrolase